MVHHALRHLQKKIAKIQTSDVPMDNPASEVECRRRIYRHPIQVATVEAP